MSRIVFLMFAGFAWSVGVIFAQPQSGLDTLIQVDGHEMYLALPSIPSDTYPVLLALHGSGREARSYRPNDPKGNVFYIHQRNLALQNGYLFVTVSNGPDTWGTDTGLHTVLTVYDYVKANYRVKKGWALWGSSAGGVLMYRLIREYPDRVDRALGTFPVYDLYDAFGRLESARQSWKTAAAFTEINPAQTPEAFAYVPILLFHGTADEAVPMAKHSERLVREVRSWGGEVTLYEAPGGHDTANMALYPDSLIDDFLQQGINCKL